MYKINLQDKKGIIFGVANQYSIAWSIAHLLHTSGAQLIFSYQDERFLKRVEPLVKSLPRSLMFPCDVTNNRRVTEFFNRVKESFGNIDFLIHCLAYAQKKDLQGRFVDTSFEGFKRAIYPSAYSLVRLSKKAEPLMKEGGSIITLSFLASERATPNYNVMGVAKAALEQEVRQLALELGQSKKIRVNAISPGPLSTLASRAISDFPKLLEIYEQKAPLGKISQGDVAGLALFLVSDLSRKITGQTIFVDGGYNIII